MESKYCKKCNSNTKDLYYVYDPTDGDICIGVCESCRDFVISERHRRKNCSWCGKPKTEHYGFGRCRFYRKAVTGGPDFERGWR
jgi:hypothetical protein